MTDMRRWAQILGDRSQKRLAALREPSRSRWPMAAVFGAGLMAGAIGAYVIIQRSQIKGLAARAFTWWEEGSDDEVAAESTDPVVTSYRSNHRRKAEAEVT